MKKYPCIEKTLDFVVGRTEVRLWIDADDVEDKINYEDIINKFYIFIEEQRTDSEKIEYLKTIVPRLNAAQIRDTELDYKLGTVAYFVDFSSDVHG